MWYYGTRVKITKDTPNIGIITGKIYEVVHEFEKGLLVIDEMKDVSFVPNGHYEMIKENIKSNIEHLKFRAWEKNLREMIEVDDIDFKREIINGSHIWRFFNEVELMQYTGLKDINGVEIYEGDILYSKGYYWLVRYGEHRYYSFGVYETSYGLIFENSNFGITSSFDDNWVVVGNIYENPELLEDE